MKYILFLFASFSLTGMALAQELNQTDAEGRKQGLWEKYREDGSLEYRGSFKDDKPVGKMERFYEDSSLQAVLYHQGNVSYAEFYYPETGVKMAEGKYVNQKKDSIWTLYSEEGNLTSRESYLKGKKEGLTTIYYASGAVSEKITFRDGLKHGLWEQYFEDGNPKLKATVVDGVMYDGTYTTYYPNGRKLLEGKYVDGKKESSWYHFAENGAVEIIYVYRNGRVAEEYPKNGTFEQFWPNDIKRSEYTYVEGKKHGPFKEWYNQGEWKNEERLDPETGITYPVQKLYNTQIHREGTYRQGELHGTVITYNEDGSVQKKVEYVMGEPAE
jgi:antitoxin component YwqK of YwqJK toxin-antitoxin module